MDFCDAVERAALLRHNARLMGKGRGRRVVEGYLVRGRVPMIREPLQRKRGGQQ